MDVSHHLHIPARQQDELTVQEWFEAVQAVDHLREELAKKD